MELPNAAEISLTVALEKRQGSESDNTYNCPIFDIFRLTFGRLYLQNQATEEHQTWNSESEGTVILIEGPTHFQYFMDMTLLRPIIPVVRVFITYSTYVGARLMAYVSAAAVAYYIIKLIVYIRAA